MKKTIYLITILLFLLSCTTQNTVTIQTTTDSFPITVEIADTTEEQMIGLMYRETLEENHGMLFIFPDEKERVFWMKNTLIPLDMIFIDKNGVIVDIIEDVQPCIADPCERYPSAALAMYVLEVNAGFVERNGISIGNLVSMEKIIK